MTDMETMQAVAREINRLHNQSNELISVLEKIASLRYSNSSAASIAQSALDTMKALK